MISSDVNIILLVAILSSAYALVMIQIFKLIVSSLRCWWNNFKVDKFFIIDLLLLGVFVLEGFVVFRVITALWLV